MCRRRGRFSRLAVDPLDALSTAKFASSVKARIFSSVILSEGCVGVRKRKDLYDQNCLKPLSCHPAPSS